jgi:hypothetical protein
MRTLVLIVGLVALVLVISIDSMNKRREEDQRIRTSREQQAKRFETSGEVRVVAGNAGWVSFGREYLAPPTVEFEPGVPGIYGDNELYYCNHTVITEVKQSGFGWKCAAQPDDERVRRVYNVSLDYARLRWRATGPVDVASLRP